MYIAYLIVNLFLLYFNLHTSLFMRLFWKYICCFNCLEITHGLNFFSTTFPYIILSSYIDLAILRLCHVCFHLGTLTLYLIFSTCNARLYLNPSKSHLSPFILFCSKATSSKKVVMPPTSKIASPHIILWLLPLDSYNFFFFFACMHAQLPSHVRLFVISWTVAPQVPLSMGFPRQDNWIGLPFPSTGNLPDTGIETMSSALAGGFFFFLPLSH